MKNHLIFGGRMICRLACLFGTLWLCGWMVTVLPEEVTAQSVEAAASDSVSREKDQKDLLTPQTRALFEGDAHAKGQQLPVSPIPVRIHPNTRTATAFSYCPEIPLSYPLQEHLQDLCQENGVQPSLALAVIRVESNFHLDAENNGSVGLMQLNSAYASVFEMRYGIENLWNAYDNLQGGIGFLGELCQHYSVPDALMAYNLGEAGMLRAKSQGIERTAYVDRVLQFQQEYQAMLEE